ncbi:MAG: hypothetical protein SVR08_02595 [Spirochaetota bacterium]|nr:hypothetical protein [Spirochaetota bacterium]
MEGLFDGSYYELGTKIFLIDDLDYISKDFLSLGQAIERMLRHRETHKKRKTLESSNP